MGRFVTCEVLTTGCNRRPRVFYPVDVVVDFPDETNGRVKGWIKRKQIKRVPDDTPLTEPKVIKAKLGKLLVKKGRKR